MRQRAEGGDFARNSEGRMIFKEEDVKKGVQRDLQHALASVRADGHLSPLYTLSSALATCKMGAVRTARMRQSAS